MINYQFKFKNLPSILMTNIVNNSYIRGAARQVCGILKMSATTEII